MNGLESLLKTIDEEILRQYTKIGKNIPDEKLYVASLLPSFLGKAFTTAGSQLVAMAAGMSPYNYGAWSLVNGMAQMPDLLYTALGSMGLFGKKSSSSAIAVHPVENTFKIYNRYIRQFVFGAGGLCLLKAGYDFMTGDPSGSEALLGLGYLSSASSMYLKDRDPALLEKASVFEKLFSPQHVLVPVRK